MKVCRICLSSDTNKDISELKVTKYEDLSQSEIFWFCFGIQIAQDSKVTQKLCLECYEKILAYHEFKTLALKNNAYLCSLHDDLKTEIEAKEEEDSCDDDDDVVLSSLKIIKTEQNKDEINSEDTVVAEKNGSIHKKKKKKKSIKEVCEECGKSVSSLKEHALVHLPMAKRQMYKCSLCDKQFTTTNARGKHFRIKHLGIKPHCNICNKDVVELSVHTKMMHKTETLKYKCTMCDRRFMNQSSLDSHMTMHSEERQFECNECHKKLKNKSNLEHHRRAVHKQEKTFLCQYCSKSFYKRDQLLTHVRIHTKEKPYKCNECGKWYQSTSSLRVHRRTHNADRTYDCTLCTKSFTTELYLQRHKVIHLKLRPYPCKYCGFKFGRTDHRRVHEYNAHEKVFSNTASESTNS